MNIPKLRSVINNINLAAKNGTINFKERAKLSNRKILKAKYSDIEFIISDTIAVINGKDALIEQNLQYFPAKIKFFYID